MKKALFLFLLCANAFFLSALSWGPGSTLKDLVNHFVEEATDEGPYLITINKIMLDRAYRVSLEGVHVQARANKAPLLDAQKITLDFHWPSFLKKEIKITKIRLTQPTLFLLFNKNKQLVWPIPPPAKEGSMPISLDALEAEKGEILLLNASVSPQATMPLTNVSLQSTLSREGLRIQALDMHLGQGTLHVEGDWGFHGSSGTTHFELQTQRFPLEKCLPILGATDVPVQLTHTGSGSLNKIREGWIVKTQGHLSGAPMMLTLKIQDSAYEGKWSLENAALSQLWKDNRLKDSPALLTSQLNFSGDTGASPTIQGDALLRLPGVPKKNEELVSATLQLKRGVGPFSFAIHSVSSRIAGQAAINLVHSKSNGTLKIQIASLSDFGDYVPSLKEASGSWTGQGQFSKNATQWKVDLQMHGDHLEGTQPNLKTADVAFHWGSEQKNSTGLDGTVKFKNDATLRTKGLLSSAKNETQFAWEELELNVPKRGQWRSRNKGAVAWRDKKHWEIRHLALVQGKETITIDHAERNNEVYQIDVKGDQINLGVLNGWSDALAFPSGGTLDADLHFNGTWEKNFPTGSIAAKASSMQVPALGLKLKELDILLVSSKEGMEIKRGSAKTRRGQITLSGRSQGPQLKFDLKSKELTLAIEKRIKAVGDVDLALTGTLQEPHLGGSVVLKSGLYRPSNTSEKKKEGAAPAVAENTLSLWQKTVMDIATRWERNVWYRDGVSSIETRGDLRVQKPHGTDPLYLTGTITALQGTYNYYGRDFHIESGQLQFTGPPDINPLMNIQASYRGDPTMVYLDLSGTVKQPILKMHSNPPLTDQDIVAVLVFGRPLSELNTRSGSGTTNQEMASMAGNILGSYVTKGLRQTGIEELNIDLLNIEPAPGGRGNQLTVGRYVTRNLFVSYEQTVTTNGEKGINAMYFLSKRWALQAEAGISQSHVDLLFRYPLNKRDVEGVDSPRGSPFRNTLDNPTLPQNQLPVQ